MQAKVCIVINQVCLSFQFLRYVELKEAHRISTFHYLRILAFNIPRRDFQRGLRWFSLTLKTMCRRNCSPLLPGYLPASVDGERSNKFAPVSLHRAWTNIFFPTPAGPVSSTARIRGPLSWTH